MTTIANRWASLRRRRFGSNPGYDMDGTVIRTDGAPKTAASEVKQEELNTLIDRSRSKATLKSEKLAMSLLHQLLKVADGVSTGELKSLLRKHEERETPEQEAAESPAEQKLEREAGVEKKAIAHGTELAHALKNSGVFNKVRAGGGHVARFLSLPSALENSGGGHVARLLAKGRKAGRAAGEHFDRNAERYLAGTGTAAAVSAAHSGRRTADAREKQVELQEKRAFLEGFKKKRREKRYGEAVSGFLGAANDMHNVHPLPHKTLQSWASELSDETHHGHAAGYNHFTDKFNAWLPTKEGEKWNDAQAAKYNKTASVWTGFEKAAALFSIKHELNAAGDAGPHIAKTLAKLRQLKPGDFGKAGLMAGAGFGGGHALAKNVVDHATKPKHETHS